MIKFKTILMVLLIVTAAGLLVRSWELKNLPAGFFVDEAINGLNAYRLLTTGKDLEEKILPFHFTTLGGRNPVAIYSMVPWISVFGVNESSVRFTMAAYGTLTVLAVFLFCSELFKSHKMRNTISLLSAILVAISPWHIHFSRTGFEFIPLTLFLSLGLACIFKFINQPGRHGYLILSSLLFGITFYTYYPIQVVLFPLVLFIIGLNINLFRQKKHWLTLVGCLTILIIAMVPFIKGIKSGVSLSRLQTATLGSKNSNFQEVASLISDTYLSHFSLEFLFSKGDIGMPRQFISRHSVRGMGELYWFQLPFLTIGIAALVKWNKKAAAFCLGWVLLYPVGSTIVFKDGPFANRSIFGLIVLQLITAFGIVVFWNLFKGFSRRIIIPLTLIVVLISFGSYVNLYFVDYNKYASDYWGWQFGIRDIMKYFIANSEDFDQLIVSNEANAVEKLVEFYDPRNECMSKCVVGDVTSSEIEWIDPDKTQLISLSASKLTKFTEKYKFDIEEIIYYPNSQPAFYIGKLNL
jgi:4-amino-4-deoxy-L-arabinose transferase-like glycosyltransferase